MVFYNGCNTCESNILDQPQLELSHYPIAVGRVSQLFEDPNDLGGHFRRSAAVNFGEGPHFEVLAAEFFVDVRHEITVGLHQLRLFWDLQIELENVQIQFFGYEVQIQQPIVALELLGACKRGVELKFAVWKCFSIVCSIRVDMIQCTFVALSSSKDCFSK